jgi:hypothetical protein
LVATSIAFGMVFLGIAIALASPAMMSMEALGEVEGFSMQSSYHIALYG